MTSTVRYLVDFVFSTQIKKLKDKKTDDFDQRAGKFDQLKRRYYHLDIKIFVSLYHTDYFVESMCDVISTTFYDIIEP